MSGKFATDEPELNTSYNASSAKLMNASLEASRDAINREIQKNTPSIRADGFEAYVAQVDSGMFAHGHLKREHIPFLLKWLKYTYPDEWMAMHG